MDCKRHDRARGRKRVAMNRVSIATVALLLLAGSAAASVHYHTYYDVGSDRHSADVHYDEETGVTWVAVDGFPAFLPTAPLPVPIPDAPDLPPLGEVIPPVPALPGGPAAPQIPAPAPLPIEPPAPASPGLPVPAPEEPSLLVPEVPDPSAPAAPEPTPPEVPTPPEQRDVEDMLIDTVGGTLENPPAPPLRIPLLP